METAVAIAKRALGGDAAVGFQTPARAYGADFVLGFDGVAGRMNVSRAGPLSLALSPLRGARGLARLVGGG